MTSVIRPTTTLADLAELRETEDVEIKLASGRDGQGELPKDFWSTYSAFANTSGGYVILGLRERQGRFTLEQGIAEPEKIRSQIFDQANNPQKVSCNLLMQADVESVQIDGKAVMSIRVPPASRRQRPVFINGNPLKGTYRRIDEGDRICDAETVKRMLAEQTEDSRDDRILQGYGPVDLDQSSIDVYRSTLRDSSPSHPFLDASGIDFLRRIRAWRQDRETGKEGLTIAGLLMFGTSETIRDEFPNYALDYQERDEQETERWVDRITTDGTWSGNIFDFYRIVWRRLTTGLKIPFRIIDGQRRDETSAHVALREAFVNTLVHADYSGRSSVLVVRRPDMFGFRNPGGMRIPPEQAIRGGESDGRNRTLQQMFLLIGAGERAGSGVPKIHKGWREQHWRSPTLHECLEPSEQTLLELRMEDLLPREVVNHLRERLGDDFETMSPEQRIVLCAAAAETTVSHARAMTLCDVHPVDLTRMLQGLVQKGYLAKIGQGRGSKYHLPGVPLAGSTDPFGLGLFSPSSDLAGQPSEFRGRPSDFGGQSSDLGSQSSDLGDQPSDLTGQVPDLPSRTAPGFSLGRRIPDLGRPFIDSLDHIDATSLSRLARSSERIDGGRVPKDLMIGVISEICEGRYVTLRVLAKLLGRSENYLRQGYLNPLVRSGGLMLAFPQSPNDPRQAYTAFEPSDER